MLADKYNWAACARTLGVTRERVRQLALRYLFGTLAKDNHRVRNPETLPKSRKCLLKKLARNLRFRPGEKQGHIEYEDYCVDCGVRLIGRGTKRIDRTRKNAYNPYGVVVCRACLRISSNIDKEKIRRRLR